MEMQLAILVLLVAHTGGYDLQIKKSCGLIKFKHNSDSTEVRNWTLHPLQDQTNVALLIYTIDFIDHYGSSTSTITLPDGIIMNFPEEKYLDDPFCRVYVKGAETGQVTCQENVEISNACKQSSRKSRTWPPTISAEFNDYSMLMYYEFIDCPANEIGSAASNKTTEETKILSETTETDQTTPSAAIITKIPIKQEWKATKILSETTETDQTTPSATDITTTTTKQGWKDGESYQSSVQPASLSSESLLYTVIALSVLLAIALLLLAIAAWKIRTLSRNASTKTTDISMNHFNDVTEQATSGHESGTQPDVISDYEMAEEGDGNVPHQKQTVDNELYQSTEKQDVINELYDCTH